MFQLIVEHEEEVLSNVELEREGEKLDQQAQDGLSETQRIPNEVFIYLLCIIEDTLRVVLIHVDSEIGNDKESHSSQVDPGSGIPDDLSTLFNEHRPLLGLQDPQEVDLDPEYVEEGSHVAPTTLHTVDVTLYL